MPDLESTEGYVPKERDEEFDERQDTIERMNYYGWKYSGTTLGYKAPDEPEQ